MNIKAQMVKYQAGMIHQKAFRIKIIKRGMDLRLKRIF
jgi:hypothetical protein